MTAIRLASSVIIGRLFSSESVCVYVCGYWWWCVSDSSPCSRDGDVTRPIHSFVLAVLSDNPTIREYLAHLGTAACRLSAATNQPNNSNIWLIFPRLGLVQKGSLLKEPHEVYEEEGNVTTDQRYVFSCPVLSSEQQVVMSSLRKPPVKSIAGSSYVNCPININN